MTQHEFDPAEFGARVRARRRRLKYSQTNVPNGPSSTYMSLIEHGEMDPITVETVDKLSVGLQWDRGVLDDVLAGQIPIEALPVEPVESPGTSTPRSGAAGGYQRELEEARREFESAKANLEVAESKVDYYLWNGARVGVLESKFFDARKEAEERLGRELDQRERVELAQSVSESITDDDLIENIAWTAAIFATARTQLEERALKQTFGDEAPSEGNVMVFKMRDDADMSEPDESLAPAADDVQDGDEKPGGSEPNE